MSRTDVWRPDDKAAPTPVAPGSVYREDILETIEQTIKNLDDELRALSMDIHDHPELRYEERHAHDALTAFMESHGFNVTRHYHLETAWLASFTHGNGGRTIGINSEMDALEGVGHACGHNLIAIAGVAVACAIKAAFEKFDINGKVELLGTPAEESGSGKVKLLDAGAYKNIDACLMCHPAPGPIGSVSLSSCLALERIQVEYFGHTAHAALSPWEGKNALDAAVLGYNNISALRQQLRPTHRVHGIFEGKDWAPNIIPDYAKFICFVRAPTRAEQQQTMKRVLPCFEAAALATGCTHKVTSLGATYDLRQNKALGNEVAHIACSKYGQVDYEWGIKSASTDFGNVTYALPSLHPGFAIPSIVDGGNHTPGFEKAAATVAAHHACLDVSKALAATGVRVVIDDEFYAEVRKTFEEDKTVRDLV
ncbi:Peptidase M20 domain-containing protein 2 [Mycena indigotica]|uniref:Peptidase M20 domain-containing protein 2 n=1 Tax=Mycena indigotica TaxID=2126181 RepID=A0A8H6S6H3_9AGAR|nr:Peptidase M20 domain-containing protein 2 [Mycena indigotica]KAF7292976.1 Peptidase M20 domain-containing protein 2 [Mycena indigotica]